MAELEIEDFKAKEVDETEARKEKLVEDGKLANKSLVNVVAAMTSEPSSETSSIAPEDEATLMSSDPDLKKIRTPRKLMEDEKRAKGRIAWPVWRTYFTVGHPHI